MLRRSLLLAWLVAILGILVPSIASAATTANLETRVMAFELVAPTLIGRSTARTTEKHPEKSNAYDEIASGSPLAAEGMGGMGGGGGSRVAQGSRPVSRAMAYDSACRMKHVDYTHGADVYESPYRAEASVGDRRPVAQAERARASSLKTSPATRWGM